MAAMTMSMDRLGIRYAAACETNGFRAEMITTDNINAMIKPMLQTWTQTVGQGKHCRLFFKKITNRYIHELQVRFLSVSSIFETVCPRASISTSSSRRSTI